MKLSPGPHVSQDVGRIVRKRICKAVKLLDSPDGSPDAEAIHDARTQFKKIRGTLKLVRPELGEKRFKKEKDVFRDAGRPLSELRDAKVLVDLVDSLLRNSEDGPLADRLASMRQDLEERHKGIEACVLGESDTVSEIVRSVVKARKRVDRWPLRRRDWRAVGPGLCHVYEQAKSAMESARRDATDEAYHRWRKRTKDLRYELELLSTNRHERLSALVEQAVEVSDRLGEDHDLAVLASLVKDRPDFGDVVTLIERRRSALQISAIALGDKLLADAPAAFTRKIRRYWREANRADAQHQAGCDG